MSNAIRQQLIEALPIPQVLVEEKHPIARSIRLRGDCLEVFGADLSQPVATFPRHHIDDAIGIYQAIDNKPRHWHPIYFPLGKPCLIFPATPSWLWAQRLKRACRPWANTKPIPTSKSCAP